MSDEWQASEAQRKRVPLLVGIMGPAGGGKTMSALEIATGIQEVVGGEIYGLDTESNRMLAYADDYRFKHVPFRAPFSSGRYLDGLRWCVGQGAKTIIVDSQSHEHAGENGYLEFHDQELNRLVGPNGSQSDRDKRNMQAWIKPSAARQKLIQGMLQLDCNFVFTFRAKERVKPDGGGKVKEMGFMPVAGDDFLFELTVCCLLMPNARGVPTWKSAMPGESMMIKPAKQFTQLFDGYGLASKPLSRLHGRGLALWANGTSPTDRPSGGPPAGATGRPTTAPGDGSQPAADDRRADPAATASGNGTADGQTGTGAPTSADTWDHEAWARTFTETLSELKLLSDFDAVWGDPSNLELLQTLSERDLPAAKRLKAAATGRRKFLREKEERARAE